MIRAPAGRQTRRSAWSRWRLPTRSDSKRDGPGLRVGASAVVAACAMSPCRAGRALPLICPEGLTSQREIRCQLAPRCGAAATRSAPQVPPTLEPCNPGLGVRGAHLGFARRRRPDHRAWHTIAGLVPGVPPTVQVASARRHRGTDGC